MQIIYMFLFCFKILVPFLYKQFKYKKGGGYYNPPSLPAYLKYFQTSPVIGLTTATVS